MMSGKTRGVGRARSLVMWSAIDSAASSCTNRERGAYDREEQSGRHKTESGGITSHRGNSELSKVRVRFD